MPPATLPALPPTFGYVSTTGKEVIAPKYFRAGKFEHGYARCFRREGNGPINYASAMFVDKNGNEFSADDDVPFSNVENKTIVSIGSKKISTSGDYVVLCKRNHIQLARNPYCYFIIDQNGKHFELPTSKWGGCGIQPESGNYAFRNSDGTFEFTGRGQVDGIPGLEPAEPTKFISRKYEINEINRDYDYFGEYSDGLLPAWSKENGWCFLDKNGKVRIKLPANCCSAQPFSEGLAAIAIGGKAWRDPGAHGQLNPLKGAKFGFIDKTGKFVIPPTFPCPEFEWKSKFKNGLALATVEKNASTAFGYINRKGKFVVPAKYSMIGEFSDGLAVFNATEPGFDLLASRSGRVSHEIVRQFLRQFEIHSMTKNEVRKRLGEPQSVREFPVADRYVLSQSCLGSLVFDVRYNPDGTVYGYSYGSSGLVSASAPMPPSHWITQPQKPDVDEDLYEFFNRAEKVTYTPGADSQRN